MEKGFCCSLPRILAWSLLAEEFQHWDLLAVFGFSIRIHDFLAKLRWRFICANTNNDGISIAGHCRTVIQDNLFKNDCESVVLFLNDSKSTV